MNDATTAAPSTVESRTDQFFPALTAAQMARIAPHGRVRAFSAGEVLVEAGDQAARFHVVQAGRVELLRPSEVGETRVAELGAGQFTGEASLLSGRRAILAFARRRPGRRSSSTASACWPSCKPTASSARSSCAPFSSAERS